MVIHGNLCFFQQALSRVSPRNNVGIVGQTWERRRPRAACRIAEGHSSNRGIVRLSPVVASRSRLRWSQGPQMIPGSHPPPPPEPPFNIEKHQGSGGVWDAGESIMWRQTAGRQPEEQAKRSQPGARRESPPSGAGESNLRAHRTTLARPSVPGFQRMMTNPQPTRPNSGTKPPARAGKPRKSISEMDALSSWNTPDDQSH